MTIESKKWVIPVTLALLLSSIIIISTPGSRGAPEGYVTMEDILVQYPSAVMKDGDNYRVIAHLSLPATKPLYLGPGERVLFDQGIFLNMTGAPLFEGTSEEPVHLEPYTTGETWGGINLMEADITTPSILKNVTIKGAIRGIRSHNSDLHIFDSRIENCTDNGLDLKGPLGSGNYYQIERINIHNSSKYGIHTLKVEDIRIQDSIITECATGVRAFGSSVTIDGLDILDSSTLGFQPVNSDIWAERINLVSTTASTGLQVLVLNTTAQFFNGKISGASRGIDLQSGSNLYLDGYRIDDIFEDGIQALKATLTILNSDLSGSKENAIDILDSTASITGTTFTNNGKSAGIVFSSIKTVNSNIKIEGCEFIGSGYAHLHSTSSSVTIGNSTLGAITNEKLFLDDGSNFKLVNIIPPSDTNYFDEESTLEYLITIEVTLLDYDHREAVIGGQVDLRNVDGDWVATGYTGPDGRTDHILIRILENSRSGALSHLPITILAQKAGYEVSRYDIESPLEEVTIDMYPPNNPPSISIIGPVNGTAVMGNIDLEGKITDDLRIFSLKVRFDEGHYRTFEGIEPDSGGYFTLSIPIDDLSSGVHIIYVHAFDNTHISPPETRRIIVIDPDVNDSDEDGIPDIDEDANGNGIWDEGDETDPNNPDTDGDLLIDGIEVDTSDGNSTDPLDHDTDGDFLIDGFEDQNMNGRVDANETDPNLKDTDGDGVDDFKDMYPLDPNRTKDMGEDGDSTAIIILATLFLIGLLVAIYLFIMKIRGASPPRSEAPSTGPRSRGGPKERRDFKERKTFERRKRH